VLFLLSVAAGLLVYQRVRRRLRVGGGPGRAIDLRTLDRHPLASVGTLVLGLRCSWCPGSAPVPKLLGLYALPPAAGATAAR
jgi:hypothetical protein